MLSTQWKRYYQGQEILLALVLGLGAFSFVLLSVSATSSFITLGILVLLVIMWMTLYETSECRYRMVYLDNNTTLQVLKNVLDAKGLPYTVRGRDLLLLGSNLVIRTNEGFNRIIVTQILLEPYEEETKLLITSLCTKIDNAFLPKGL